MEDKAFELLTKMYSEFTGFKEDMSAFREETNLKFDNAESRLKNIEITLENDIAAKLQALHEREAINSEKLDDHSEQLANINNKLDYLAISINSQDKRLEVIETSKRKRAK